MSTELEKALTQLQKQQQRFEKATTDADGVIAQVEERLAEIGAGEIWLSRRKVLLGADATEHALHDADGEELADVRVEERGYQLGYTSTDRCITVRAVRVVSRQEPTGRTWEHSEQVESAPELLAEADPEIKAEAMPHLLALVEAMTTKSAQLTDAIAAAKNALSSSKQQEKKA